MSNVSLGSQLCIVAYSDSFRLNQNALGFASVVQQLSWRLGVDITDFAYHTLENLEDRGDQFSYGPENLNRLKQFITQESILDLKIWSDHGSHAPAWDIYAEIVDAKDIYGIRYAYIQFPQDLISHLSEQSQFKFAQGLFASLNRLGGLDCAFVTTMGFVDMPWLYFRGILIPDVSHDLKLNLALWQRQLADCKKKLRGIFWINFLGASHLSSLSESESFIHSLTDLIGIENFATIGENSFLFRVPSVRSGPNSLAISVQNLLIEHNLLMLPNVADIQVVLDNSFRRIHPTF